MMKQMIKIAAYALLALMGTSHLLAQENTQQSLYFGTGAEGIFTSLFDDTTGKLTEPRLAAELPRSGFLVSSPDQKVLYSTTRLEGGGGGVASFRRSADGTLSHLNSQPSQGDGACHVSLDATGRTLLVANYGSGSVASYQLQENGQLSPPVSFIQHKGSSVNPQRQKGPHAHSIYAGPDNKFAYAPDLGTDEVVIHKLDPAKSTLHPSGAAKTPPGAGPRHMKFSKDGKQAYVLSELQLNILIYDRDPTSGQLTLNSEISTLPEGASKEQMSCSEIRVSADGRFVYCANRDLTEEKRDSLSVFLVNADGSLKRVQTIHAEVWIPRNIKLSPSGKWLLVAGQRSNEVAVFKVSPKDGTLSFTKQKITVPKAMCIEF